MIEEGQKAPALRVKASDGSTVDLAAPGQKLVLYFYPKDDTSGCTKEAQDFTAHAADFAKAGAKVIGVSRDSELEKTLFAVDELSGFLVACAVVRPQGIHGLTPKSVKKKLKQPSFAAAVNRDEVRHGAEVLGVDFDEHLRTLVAALEARADELDLYVSAAAA